jgi:acetyl-CoA acetyltransferase
MKREAVIVSAVRTPVGRCRGALAAVGAPELGALVIWTVLKNKPADDDSTPLSSRKPVTQS